MRRKDVRRAMAFIDGTNFFYRLQDAKVRLKAEALFQMVARASSTATLTRVYFYSTASRVEQLKKTHDAAILWHCKVVLGQEVALPDGNVREKGVDALLVADLVYHAARGNIDEAIVMTCDTDFVHAIERVGDFGVTTRLLSFFADAPERLVQASDDYTKITPQDIEHYIVKILPNADTPQA